MTGYGRSHSWLNINKDFTKRTNCVKIMCPVLSTVVLSGISKMATGSAMFRHSKCFDRETDHIIVPDEDDFCALKSGLNTNPGCIEIGIYVRIVCRVLGRLNSSGISKMITRSKLFRYAQKLKRR